TGNTDPAAQGRANPQINAQVGVSAANPEVLILSHVHGAHGIAAAAGRISPPPLPLPLKKGEGILGEEPGATLTPPNGCTDALEVRNWDDGRSSRCCSASLRGWPVAAGSRRGLRLKTA